MFGIVNPDDVQYLISDAKQPHANTPTMISDIRFIYGPLILLGLKSRYLHQQDKYTYSYRR